MEDFEETAGNTPDATRAEAQIAQQTELHLYMTLADDFSVAGEETLFVPDDISGHIADDYGEEGDDIFNIACQRRDEQPAERPVPESTDDLDQHGAVGQSTMPDQTRGLPAPRQPP